jgi:phosphotransferase system enzyme I (PtsI)
LKKESRKTEFLQQLLESQLRALYRASCYGDIKILFPMIRSEEEGRTMKVLALQIQEELGVQTGENGAFPEIGFMLETKTAIQDSDKLAKVGEFFKIGTNDLTRQNPSEDVMQMIAVAIANVHAEGKPIGICGEMAADMSLTDKFIQMGVDELSVSPSKVLKLRKRIREIE